MDDQTLILEKIECLGKVIRRETKNLVSLTDKVYLQHVCSLANDSAIEEQRYAGLYLIEAYCDPRVPTSDWIMDFTTEWTMTGYDIKNAPRVYKNRVKAHYNYSEWMPIYLGKSRDIRRRVLEHLNLGKASKTFALKMKERPNIWNKHKFGLRTLRLNYEIYDFIAHHLEESLRNKINPLIGRQ